MITETDIAYFSGKRILIVEATENARGAYESAFKEVGIERKNVKFAKSISIALSLVNEFQPNIIVSYEFTNNERYNDLLKFHLKLFPNRLNNSFILITDKNSIEAKSKIAQLQVDLVLESPFTIKTIEKKFKELEAEKANPAKYRVLINSAYEYIGKNHSRVKEISDEARQVSSYPYETYYLDALCEYKDKNYELALSLLQKSYQINPTDFNTLKLTFKTYKHQKNFEMALKYSLQLRNNFDVSPDMIKDLCMVSVAAQEHHLIEHYYAAYKKILEPSIEIKDAIAAALVIYSRCELQELGFKDDNKQRFQEILKLLEEAAIICVDKPFILEQIVVLLFKTNDTKTSKFIQIKQREKFPDYENSPLMDALVADKDSTAAQSLKCAIDTLNKGFKSEELFEIIIKRAIEIDRNDESLKELYEQAIKQYPHIKPKLDKYYS